MSDQHQWVAARRLTSAFNSGSADNFLAIVAEIDAIGGWKTVALALTGDVTSLAQEVYGARAQQWLDGRIALLLDRMEAEQTDTA